MATPAKQMQGDIHDNDDTALAKAVGDAIKLTEVKRALPELRALCQRKIDAQDSFREAVKAVAEKAGMNAQALSAYVTAVVRGKEDEHHERARQLDLLFEEFDD